MRDEWVVNLYSKGTEAEVQCCDCFEGGTIPMDAAACERFAAALTKAATALRASAAEKERCPRCGHTSGSHDARCPAVTAGTCSECGHPNSYHELWKGKRRCDATAVPGEYAKGHCGCPGSEAVQRADRLQHPTTDSDPAAPVSSVGEPEGKQG